jgi:hypothetical protein
MADKFYTDAELANDPRIFVFGSNLSGIHGGGAARQALEVKGAKWGQGEGRMGMSYAIPTKDKSVKYALPLTTVKKYVNEFLEYAREHYNARFLVTKIGCGLAGLKESDIKPMFKNAPSNCDLPEGWR